METGDAANRPSPDEAGRLLEAAAREADATRNPPLPRRFFAAQAIAAAVICGAQLLESPVAAIVTAAGFASLLAVGIRYVFYRPGYGVVLPDGRAAFPFMLTLFAVAGIPAVLADGTGMPWLWLLAAAGAAAAILDLGRRYRKAVPGA